MNGNKFIDEASLETTNFDYSSSFTSKQVIIQGFCLVCKMMIIIIITTRQTTFLIKIRYWRNSIELTQIQPLGPFRPVIDLTHKHIETGNFGMAQSYMSKYYKPAQNISHWTYFMQILSYYNTKSLFHIENSAIKALKSDIFHSYACKINIGDIWLQFEKLKKICHMALSYRNIKNKY